MDNKLIPNSTQIPNILMDFVIPLVPEAEAKCLLYICRRTFGFHKDEDQISFSQFTTGITGRDGKVLDKGTGLARRTVATGLKNLIKSGAIEVEKNSRGNIYRINLDMDIDEVVQKLHQCRKDTNFGAKNAPKQVQLLHLQKKGNKGNKEIPCGDVDKPADKSKEEHFKLSDQMKFEYDKTFGKLKIEKQPPFSLVMKLAYERGKDEVIVAMGNLREAKNFYQIKDFRPYLVTMCKSKE